MMIRTGSDVFRSGVLLSGAVALLHAQSNAARVPLRSDVRAPSRSDSRITLVLRPFPGDMIRQRVEHDVDEQGTITMPTGDSTVRVSTRTMVVLRSRVDAVDSAGAYVTSTVESVTVNATGGKDESRRARIANGQSLRGRTLRMRLSPDGELMVLDDGPAQAATAIATLAALVDRVPAALPVLPVREREKWTRHMLLAGAPGDGIDAEFQIDSLTKYGDEAWISVRGVMKDAGADAGASVVGWILLDRRRGWITKSRMVMTLRAVTGAQPHMPPMRFVMRVEQRVGEVVDLRVRK
jgi:hypothetical protein